MKRADKILKCIDLVLMVWIIVASIPVITLSWENVTIGIGSENLLLPALLLFAVGGVQIGLHWCDTEMFRQRVLSILVALQLVKVPIQIVFRALTWLFQGRSFVTGELTPYFCPEIVPTIAMGLAWYGLKWVSAKGRYDSVHALVNLITLFLVAVFIAVVQHFYRLTVMHSHVIIGSAMFGYLCWTAVNMLMPIARKIWHRVNRPTAAL